MTNFQATVAPRRFVAEAQPVALPLHPALTGGVSAAEKAAVLSHLTNQLALIGQPGEDIEDLLYAIDSCVIALGRAERVLRTGDLEAGRDIVRSAAKELGEMV